MSAPTMPNNNWQQQRRQQLILHALGFIRILFAAVLALSDPTQEHYHTSILTGKAWVLELLLRHPEQIYTELGVHHHVFYLLIAELKSMGYGDSQHVTLEEQLAIFLYASVMGLSIWHLSECFQQSIETISWFVPFSYELHMTDHSLQLLLQDAIHFFLTAILHKIHASAKSR